MNIINFYMLYRWKQTTSTFTAKFVCDRNQTCVYTFIWLYMFVCVELEASVWVCVWVWVCASGCQTLCDKIARQQIRYKPIFCKSNRLQTLLLLPPPPTSSPLCLSFTLSPLPLLFCSLSLSLMCLTNYLDTATLEQNYNHNQYYSDNSITMTTKLSVTTNISTTTNISMPTNITETIHISVTIHISMTTHVTVTTYITITTHITMTANITMGTHNKSQPILLWPSALLWQPTLLWQPITQNGQQDWETPSLCAACQSAWSSLPHISERQNASTMLGFPSLIFCTHNNYWYWHGHY